jgi:hypothetical protein
MELSVWVGILFTALLGILSLLASVHELHCSGKKNQQNRKQNFDDSTEKLKKIGIFNIKPSDGELWTVYYQDIQGKSDKLYTSFSKA